MMAKERGPEGNTSKGSLCMIDTIQFVKYTFLRVSTGVINPNSRVDRGKYGRSKFDIRVNQKQFPRIFKKRYTFE